MTEQIDQQLEPADQRLQVDARSASEAAVASGAEVPAEEPDVVATLRQELAAAQSEAAAPLDKFLRARADIDNYKKRIERTYGQLEKHSKKQPLDMPRGLKGNMERAPHYG